ncbi:hypothetical protein D3Z60_22505 [Lachnospiraceae bacterium]|nr:hypothetical protein [Lachnospiraceae bacterium]
MGKYKPKIVEGIVNSVSCGSICSDRCKFKVSDDINICQECEKKRPGKTSVGNAVDDVSVMCEGKR